MSPAAPLVQGSARSVGLRNERSPFAADSPQKQKSNLAGAHIVQRLVPLLSIRCGGLFVYSVPDVRVSYQAYSSLSPGDLRGSGLCGHERYRNCGRDIIKGNRLVDLFWIRPGPKGAS